MWLFFAFGSAFFAGLTAVLAKIGIRSVDSTLATAIRTVVVLVFAWTMVGVVGSFDTIATLSSKSLTFLVLSGIATGASWLCYFKALQLADVTQVTPIDKSSTLITMILAIVLFGERFSALTLVAMCCIALGTYLMVDLNFSQKSGKSSSKWLFYAVASALFAALTSILGKVGITGVESNLGTAIRTIVVLGMSWLMVFLTQKGKGIRLIDRQSWIFLVLSGFATGGSWLCYYRALQTGPASVVVPIDKLSILATVGFSYVFLKERLKPSALVGLAILVSGTLLLLVH